MANSTLISIWDELKAELEAQEGRQMRRRLRTVEQNEGARLTINGKSLINFSSNNYLGMARHPQVLEAVQQVMGHWGIGATSSRLISGTDVIHADLEQALAAFMKTEAALVFPTGYQANVGAITALVGQGDAIIMDRLCHASLIDAAHLSGARLFVYAHANLEEAERALQRAASYRRKLLVTDSLFSMDGDFAPLEELAKAAQRHGAISYLDEAHAIGVWGDSGNGARHGVRSCVYADAQMQDLTPSCWDVVVGTLSKALGSQGGFVTGSQILIDTLINRARSFIYTTGLSPACVAGAHAALSLIQEEATPRNQLHVTSRSLREGLQSMGWNTLGSQSQIVPILLGSADRALACSAHLEASGVFAPAIRPPTVPAGECRIRFSVTTEHTKEDIDQLLTALKTLTP